MTLPASGAIAMSQVATELGIGTSGINLNLASVRTLAGRASGAISMSDLWGKSNAPSSALLLNGGGVSSYASSTATATARANFNADGTYSLTGTGYSTIFGRWQNNSDGANYEMYWGGGINQLMGANWSQGTYAGLEVQRFLSLTDTSGGLDDETNCTIRQKTNTANTTTFSVYLQAAGRCFALGTLLRTPEGDRTVESFAAGDTASSFAEPSMVDEATEGWRDWTIASLDNVDTGTTATVRNTRQFDTDVSVKINGIHSTLEHVYFVFDGTAFGWKEAVDISGSDFFVDSEKNLVPITSIEPINERTTFVALNVELLDTLQVKSGDIYILTHNVSA